MSSETRRVLIFVIGAAVVFNGFMFAGGDRSTEYPADPLVHPPALPDWVSALGAVTSPFAPRLTLAGSPFTLTPSKPLKLNVDKSAERGRIAKLRLTSGRAAHVIYDCGTSADDTCKQQDFCLVARDATVPAECPPSPKPMPSGSVLARDVGGTLTLVAPAGPAVVELN
ncbi:hypothetical protein [Bradyrhizobium sp. SZCCHNS3051]|uniref:hypothetical protein n=1 Tax=Bradyrhizobium sp. SZCCHNS3051 TaxID=3057320 RepID=UPI002915ED8F|nr:hypothetical protein [Bradyrhizobium sp. SZCCHNS3051]